MTPTLKGASMMLIATLISAPSLSEVYKWTDENGVTHYGDQKPLNQAAQKLDIKTQNSSSNRPNPVDQAKQLEKDKEAELEEKAKRLKAQQGATLQQERCEQARTALKNYEEQHRILDGTGDEPRVLSHEEKIKKMEEFKQIIREECN